MKNKRLRGGVQNVCLILLTLSALFLLARLPMLREIRLPGQVPCSPRRHPPEDRRRRSCLPPCFPP